MISKYLPASWTAPVDVLAGGRRLVKGHNARATLVFSALSDAERTLRARDALVLAEAYVQGLMDIEGDIYDVIGLKNLFYPERLRFTDKARIVLSVAGNYRRHTLKKDREYIKHHYEHPDEFYALFLGRTMAYSCAYFTSDEDDLDQAQQQKIDHLLGKLHTEPGDRLLDIGCGWGALVIRAAEKWGARATGITLSSTQHAYANRRIRELGLEGSCHVELLDYRELPSEPNFDKIVSVGMYEHVGGKNLGEYFQGIYELLSQEGLFVNHGITRRMHADWRRASEAMFIDKYIFPGGEVHPSSRVVHEMEDVGFEVFDAEALRRHYALTLRHWVANLQANAAHARELVPESIYRAWVLYLAGCALAFEDGYLNVHQVAGSKIGSTGRSRVAWTRDHLYRDVRQGGPTASIVSGSGVEDSRLPVKRPNTQQ